MSNVKIFTTIIFLFTGYLLSHNTYIIYHMIYIHLDMCGSTFIIFSVISFSPSLSLYIYMYICIYYRS